MITVVRILIMNVWLKSSKKTNFTSCPSKCMHPALRLIGGTNLSDIPACKSEEENHCFWKNIYFNLYSRTKYDTCPRQCTIQEYSGRIDYLKEKKEPSCEEGKNSTLTFSVRFASPYMMTFSEEYLIYNVLGMVGSVGGTLGLFLGFSFYDTIVKLTTLIRKNILTIK